MPRTRDRKLWAFLPRSRRAGVGFLVVVAALATADPTVPSLIVGASISLLGELVRIVTAGYGYKSGAHSLRGPYRYVRHPYFLGSALLFLGICVAGRNPFTTGGALVALAVLYAFEIEADEVKVRSRLGPAFADYKARVPAILPRLFPYRPEPGAWRVDAAGHNFSLGLSLFRGRHREFDAIIGLIVGFALLYGVIQLASARSYFRVAVLGLVGVYVVARIIYHSLLKRRPT